MRRLAFWVDGAPVSYRGAYARSRRPSSQAIAWRQAVVFGYLEEVRRLQAGQPPAFARYWPVAGEYVGRVSVHIDVWGSNADWDNIAKEISDALEGTAYVNDRQVVSGKVKINDRIMSARGGVSVARDSTTPGVQVTLVFWDL